MVNDIIHIIYTVSPYFSQSYALMVEYNRGKDEEAKLWVHFGNLGMDFIEPTPWRTDIRNIKKSEPDKLNIEESKSIIMELESLNISPVPEFTTGCDGTQYKLTIDRGLNGAAYRWWCDLPPEWKAFEPLIVRFENIINTKRANA